MPPVYPSVEVLEVKLEALEHRLEDRHASLLQQLALRDEALAMALERLQDALTPMGGRVDRLERFQAKALGILGAGMALVPVLTWVVDKVVK